MSEQIPTLTRRRGFVVVTGVLGLFLAAASAPSPLYAVYAARWGFSAIQITAVFAVYAVALLLTLLLAGTLSDSVGRRPVILIALILLAVSLILFLAAGSLPMLYAARVLQGVATGMVTSAVAAALIDLQSRPGQGPLVNAVTPAFGLAAGALIAGALVEYAPAPTRLVYTLLLSCTVLAIAALALIPETVAQRRPVHISVQLGLEARVRPVFFAVLPCLVATWALGGLYLSLGPSIAYSLQGSANRLLGGAVIAMLAGTGGLAGLAVNRVPPRKIMEFGCGALAAGAGITVIGTALTAPVPFYLGTVIAGAGFGSAFLGAFRTLAVLASSSRRGELAAAIYIAAYLAFSLPTVAAGLLVARIGLTATATGYGLGVGILAVAALILTRLSDPRARPTPTTHTNDPAKGH